MPPVTASARAANGSNRGSVAFWRSVISSSSACRASTSNAWANSGQAAIRRTVDGTKCRTSSITVRLLDRAAMARTTGSTSDNSSGLPAART